MHQSHPPTGAYDLKSVKLPYLSGWLLRLFIGLLESPLRCLIIPGLFKSAGISWLRRQTIAAPPTFFPLRSHHAQADAPSSIPPSDWPQTQPADVTGFRPASILDYAAAYRSGQTDPHRIAEKVLSAILTAEAAEPPLRAFIAVDHEDVRKQAEESAYRLQSGQPLSVFDGVPVAVKDEMDMRPYPTTVGTAFLGKKPCLGDATIVARLRSAGALLIGKTNMHEIGIGVTGLNLIHGTPRNPYAAGHYPGGSSSGPAVAVAAGLCPVALGADGGGSIRIPASFCGVVGLKPTFGRLSEHGAAPLCWSVAHLGPIGGTATDTALAYAAIAGADPADPNTLYQAPPDLRDWNNPDLSRLTIGLFTPWFRHSAPDIVSGCEQLLQALVKQGVKIEEIELPGLEAARIAHTLTIASEMAVSLKDVYEIHYREHNADVRINLALARTFTARDYLQAQKVRTNLIATINDALSRVDAIVTPATGITAPPIPAQALRSGESDLTTLMEIMRFSTPANLTGLPAIAFPAGYDSNGLPIGMQIIGRPWQETTLLRFALAAERMVERRQPQVYFNLLA